jgi:formylmethanofuran dehydrogenase subunit E
LSNTRSEIERMIVSNDLANLLRKTGEIHGHHCSYSSLGVKAAHRAMKELGIVESTGMEHILAIVETNNCFSDGVQVVTGCTFGNNSLIYKDYGKTALTLLRRDGTGVRIAVKPEAGEILSKLNPKISELRRKVMEERTATQEEEREFVELSKKNAFDILSLPDEELFTVNKVRIEPPASYSRILASVQCAECGERVMETRAVTKEGRTLCIPCAKAEYYQLDWSGISAKKNV